MNWTYRRRTIFFIPRKPDGNGEGILAVALVTLGVGLGTNTGGVLGAVGGLFVAALIFNAITGAG